MEHSIQESAAVPPREYDGVVARPQKANGVALTARVERRVLRDSVHEAILEILLGNKVAPGDSLSIDGLARDLGVSPTPVREALVQLEHTGLLTRAALKGYRVAPPLSGTDMGEMLQARSVVEVAAIQLAVPAAADVIAQLEIAHARHREAADLVRATFDAHPDQLDWSTMRAYYAADWEFHRILLQNCGNRYLLEMAESLAPHIHRLRQLLNRRTIDVDLAHAEHTAILDAVRSGDPHIAAAAMTMHLAAVKNRATSGH